MNIELLNHVSAFIWQEADMLDHGEFDAWLNLWAAAACSAKQMGALAGKC